MRLSRTAVVALVGLGGALLIIPSASAATTPTVTAVNVFNVLQGSTAPVGDVNVTESVAAQLPVGDKVTFTFTDAASASTLHFGTTPSVGGSNGLAGTVRIFSSNTSGTPLLDRLEVTVSAASTGVFPGVLTLSSLNPAIDLAAGTGGVRVIVADTAGQLSGALTSDANVLAAATSKAGFSPQTNPTILSTGSTQVISNVVLTEPTKSFFKTGDVLTLTLHDTTGSADTVGLAATPSAGGGSMQVSVHGATTDTVQTNDTAFRVRVDTQDPSNGSTSSITITNLLVNTAKAPLGSVTLTAVLTTGAATEYVVPARVVVAGVGGNTATSAAGVPSVALGGTGQPAANVTIDAAAGSLLNGDTFSTTIQEAGVTFTASAPPQATVTTGDLVLTSSTASLDPTGKTAIWTVKTGNGRSASVVIGPIYYDVAGTATAGNNVTLSAAGNPGSAFNSQNIDNAAISRVHAVARFTTLPADLAPLASAPWTGAPVQVAETAAGSLAVGSTVVLITPYATQIAAYRTTFAAIPSAAVTGGLVLGTPTVNSSATVVQTTTGPITAPAQTVVSFPVTAASTTTGTVTISNLVYSLGSYVAPGALVGTGAVVAAGGASAADGEQYVDAVIGRGLGSTSSTVAPVVTFTSYPPSLTTATQATFAWVSNPTGADFSCTIDGVNFGRCVSPLTFTGLASATHTFSVTPTLGSQTGVPASYTWTVDNTPPTATTPAGTPVSGPLAVTFSKPVLGASSTSVVWTDAATAVAIPGAVTCLNGSTIVVCNGSNGVTKLLLKPTTALTPGGSYLVTVPGTGSSITGIAGTPMASTTLTTRASTIEQETSLAAVVAWRKVASSSASGGSYAVAHKAGARSTFTFTGTSASWYAVRGPSDGTANVYLDGALKRTVNLYASTTSYGFVGYAVTGLANSKHQLVVLVNGAKGTTAATDTNVTVDRFLGAGVTAQQDAASVGSTWRRVSATAASGGGYSIEDLPGASHSMTFRGTGIAWYVVKGPGMGKANVYVDGILKGTIDLYASALAYSKLGYSLSGLSTTALHTVKIVVLGQRRTGASGNAVTVDRFVIS